MGKNLSLLFLFHTIILLHSCISTDGTMDKLSGIEEREETFLEDSDFIIEDKIGIALAFNDRQKFEDTALMETLEDHVTEELSASQRDQVGDSNEILEYQSKKNETLMLIAFNIYGDYRKWRELHALNKEVLGDSYDLSHRPVLKYRKPLKSYTLPIGNPYLIKSGDSLSLISKKVYGNWREWPIIYKNNPQQIRDPNLIFAGFTLYYPSLDKMALQLY
ncbi:MAG: hypothetical protein COW00_03935 [Bdellovibrio sp. CG12_big_fil_rev_8_21_14_0_65_39_13]|nr:MAG: hypothetical protein COW78_12080 [Bdellovibrio sp. CG22_combo_CG10-13_8_21_14_all_39_27]PIQ61400.1 MAG: hypothetical protein COW00_03935 [Bdellovibrio sp. CG12_big_fil_rev_8_21_14_0_65_39_13]PIR36899.1 MAG: hypothetical protein COV37_00975 [Bdellovibrio sp. CG11_big_fil_rev_8_21_14_0_20_39_38]